MLDFANIKTRNENETIGLFSKMSAPQLRTLLYKNRDVVADFKYYVSNGIDKAQAIEESLYSFNGTDSEKNSLINWMLNI